MVQPIQQTFFFEFLFCFLHSNQKGEVKPTLQTWLQIKIMPEDHSSQLEFLQKSGSENALRRCLGVLGSFLREDVYIYICRRETKAQ